MRKILFIWALALSSYAFAQEDPLQQKAHELASSETFSHAYIGIKAASRQDGEIVGINTDKLFIPASNMKLISTGTALAALGIDYCFSTDIAHDGTIENGILHGNLYIIGNGDPLTGSKDSLAVPLEKLFCQWEEIVRLAGITAIEGHIIGDGRWLDGMPEEEGWLWEDVGTYYGTGMAGLNFHENMISFDVNVSSDTSLVITQRHPMTSWMEIKHSCSIGGKGTGDNLYMYTSDLAPKADIRGTYGIDRGAKRVDFSNKFPEYTCAVYFKNHLEKKGIKCSMGAADFRLKTQWLSGAVPSYGLSPTGDSLKIIGNTHSPALSRIIFKTNHESNNLLAEALFRLVGETASGDSSYESSREANADVLKGLVGESYNKVMIRDGSGLSRQNLISPDFMCTFLQAMMDTPCFEEFIASLPVPGENGTLTYNMRGYTPQQRARFRVKSGSMNGVRCYSGYIFPSDYTYTPGQTIPQEIKDRIIVFSIMTNNCISKSWKVRPALDRFMAELAGF